MRKILLVIIMLWLVTIIISFQMLEKEEEKSNLYRVNINRIHSNLENNVDSLNEKISEIRADNIEMISAIDIIKLENLKSSDFEVGDIYKTSTIIKPLKNSNYLIKYTVELDSKDNIIVIHAVSISILILLLLFYILYEYFNIIRPIKEIARIPKQLSTGYIEKLNLKYSYGDFNRFIWGLDMLREKLENERDNNLKLEKDRKTFVAGLSHDIKTPLSSIKNYAIALLEDIYEEKDEQEVAITIIKNRTEDIEKLVARLIKNSTKEINADIPQLNRENIYMNEIDKRLNEILHQTLDIKKIKYHKVELKENLLLSTDIDAISQVFLNIIENAIKYGDMKNIDINYYREDYYQMISIFNTGEQISKTEVKHIFKSYYRGSNTGEKSGYGLGLYICKKIMQDMDGDIFAENFDGGVRFVVLIRLAD